MRREFAEMGLPADGAFVVGALEGPELQPSAKDVDARLSGALARALESGRFRGKKDQVLSLPAPHGLSATRVVLLGLGKADALSPLTLQESGGALAAHLNRAGEKKASIACDPVGGKTPDEVGANLLFGASLRAYRFDKYRTKQKEEDKPTLETLIALSPDPAATAEAFKPLESVADGVIFARDLVSEPSNYKYPEKLAERLSALADVGVDIEVLKAERLRELGMGSLLSVGQGSARAPCLVVMRWMGAPEDTAPLAFVGKGVTFDTGGISLKPAQGMEDMKYDMAGAAAVSGLMRALAGRKARVNAVGVVGLAENMPSGTASRPGDVVTSMSGQTIEIVNTDAEGRLVLADTLWYAQDRFKPRFMIDLATLTGAIVVSLGTYQAGLFSNNDELAERIVRAGRAVGERAWRMPLAEAYDKDINSEIADVKNVGKGREAGSIAGAKFLQRFVNKTPWAHIDIAGMAWAKKDMPLVPTGASGFGVRLLDRFIADHTEA